jgi:hypothetical protein
MVELLLVQEYAEEKKTELTPRRTARKGKGLETSRGL